MDKSKSMKRAVLTAFATTILTATTAHAGMVSVSNYPLALLSKAVTQGKNDASVLLEAGDVGHHGSLSPSKAKLIAESDFVVWFGKDLEQNLVKSLQDAPNSISLLSFNAFNRLPLRELDGTPKQGTQDVHLWLDPDNAKAIVRALAVIHSHAAPEHKAFYQQNAQDFAIKMDQAVAKVAKPKPLAYWAYHDAYQYIEKSGSLRFAGALTPDHHLAPKASQFRVLNDARPSKANGDKTMCLVSQGKVSDGIKNKLGQVVVSIQQEDMSGGTDDFVESWLKLVNELQACATATQ